MLQPTFKLEYNNNQPNCPTSRKFLSFFYPWLNLNPVRVCRENNSFSANSTCDFKKKQYKRLLAPLNFEVEYIYILNDWFKKPEYKDVLTYIHSVGCDYYFNYIPLQRLGLPIENWWTQSILICTIINAFINEINAEKVLYFKYLYSKRRLSYLCVWIK